MTTIEAEVQKKRRRVKVRKPKAEAGADTGQTESTATTAPRLKKRKNKGGTATVKSGDTRKPSLDEKAAAADGFPTKKDGSLSAKGIPCLFSGEQTINPKARFLPGYDAKLKSVLVRVEKGELNVNDIPVLARQWMTQEPLVGFAINAKGKLIRAA